MSYGVLSRYVSDDSPRMPWPHAPPHWMLEQGTYFVTAGTYLKEHRFGSRGRLRFLHDLLLSTAGEFGWALEAWAVFSNHYHFVAKSPQNAETLREMLKKLHGSSARWLNSRDSAPGRKVWHNFRETRLTYEASYYARLSYVHRNAVHHGLVLKPEDYPWCSARWFERHSTPAQIKTVYGFKTDRLKVEDDFEPFKG